MATTQVKNGWHGGSDDQLLVNPDGSINVNSTGGGTTSTNLTQVGGAPISEGQKTMANSFPVVIASDQSTINVNSTGSSTVSGTVNTNLNGLNTFQTSQYTVGTSATQITVTPLTNRSSMSIKVRTAGATDVVYVGNSSGVTSSTGFPLFNGDSVQLDVTPAQATWVIGSAAGQTVYVLELGG